MDQTSSQTVITLADIDTAAMSREDHLIDATVVGLIVKEARGELSPGLKTALIQQIAAECKCTERTVWRHLERRCAEPENPTGLTLGGIDVRELPHPADRVVTGYPDKHAMVRYERLRSPRREPR